MQEDPITNLHNRHKRKIKLITELLKEFLKLIKDEKLWYLDGQQWCVGDIGKCDVGDVKKGGESERVDKSEEEEKYD